MKIVVEGGGRCEYDKDCVWLVSSGQKKLRRRKYIQTTDNGIT